MFIDQKNELIAAVLQLQASFAEYKDDTIDENINIFLDEVKDDLTFNVLCLGDFSSGKSTFINQFFIKNDILPTSVTTTTAKLTIIKYAETPKITLLYKDGSQQEILENLDTSLIDFVAKDGKKIDKIDCVEVYINSPFLKEGVVIVDSPGLNDPEAERMKITFDYIKKADSVLYLLTAMQAWKNSEEEFLEDKILRKVDLDKIFFLLNFWDLVEENQQKEKVINYVKKEMKKSLQIASTELGAELSPPPLIPISAKTKENFDTLYTTLWDYLGSKKGQDILEAKYKKLEHVKLAIKELLEAKIDIQKKERVELEGILSQLKDDMEECQKDVDIFREGLKQKINTEVVGWLNAVKESYKVLPHTIMNKLNNKIKSVSGEEEFKHTVKTIIDRTLHVESDKFDTHNRHFLKTIDRIAQEERAKLKIDKFFLKHSFMDVNQLKEYTKEDIDPSIKNKAEDYLVIGGSVALSAALACIAPPLALIGLASMGFHQLVHKPKEEKNRMRTELENIEEELEKILFSSVNEIEYKEDEITEEVLSSIKNDLVEAYDEKVRIYEEALQSKELGSDNEKIAHYQKGIDILLSQQ